MSFQLPSRVPSFKSPQREIEDDYWRAATSARKTSHNAGGGFEIADRIGQFMNPNRELPMYKDKPYSAARRGPGGLPGHARSRRRKQVVWLGVLVAFAVTVWWLWSGGRAEKIISRGKEMKGMHGGELWKWVQGFEKGEARRKGKTVDWAERRERVKDAFMVSWDGYERYAWGRDEYYPIRKSGRNMVDGGMGWIIVDALDTLMIMNLTSRVQQARNWIHTSLRYDQDHDVNTFETTIRMLGGLLSAHYLSTTYPELAPIADDDPGAPGEDLYIEKATELADRLLGAFESPSGVPYASLNLNKSVGILSHSDNGASSTAEAGTVQLEFKYLAKLTGEANYWEKAEKVIEVIEANGREDGLVPIYIYADTGKFMGENIRLGSRGDSYYEYLIKQYLQTSNEEPIYLEMWDETLNGIRKHLLTYTKHASLTIVGERPNGLRQPILPKMDHLVCFLPGTIALGATGGLPLSEARRSAGWGRKQEEEMLLAKELMKTCWATYLATATGLAPEITYFKIDDPPRTIKDVYPDFDFSFGGGEKSKKKKTGLRDDADLFMKSHPLYPLDREKSIWLKDITIRGPDQHNLQRPETVESLFYMYRITGDETYRFWGWEMFKSFIKHTAVVEDEPSPGAPSDDASYIRGFTSLSNANTIPPVKRDNMESFWLAETLKYFYLLFSERDFIPLETTVFNTEAHIFPRFKMGKNFKTGWRRKFPVNKVG
ncbi:mannosyl-oligosaccharide 1,2-alpha-mannosidase [Coccidioides immitis RS]|uniref:alpha-1,2-Mannosidase n=2 Tax=Coccidioides immitis TaxID=5501 RepID=J3KA39_COCIM|nr:mannosyl-oligosaccharide 1,2-alpha-mannosidase [Coccidioides immitis RS]EAS31846.3 mannosyl-oligosaccharide 1,2-alpha-mannosidase [Coccidioides immitis RS]KMP02442.1 mannosyl-oligosaccharide alpha-1,2-mannosidase [Coccidioides immitis RMSCC 2394]